MSQAFDKGKGFEQDVAGMIRRKLQIAAVRDSRSGANWHRKSDIFSELPIHIEAKDHETVKIKEWYRQAEAAASFNQTPTVVFRADEFILATLEFSQLLDLFVRIADLEAENEDLRKPIENFTPPELATIKAEEAVSKTVETKIERGDKTCKAGHLADNYGYCMQVTCPYSRGYVKPKKKGKK